MKKRLGVEDWACLTPVVAQLLSTPELRELVRWAGRPGGGEGGRPSARPARPPRCPTGTVAAPGAGVIGC